LSLRQERLFTSVLISGDCKLQPYEMTKSGQYELKLLEIIITHKFHLLDTKISTLTGMTVPVERVKEISSNSQPV